MKHAAFISWLIFHLPPMSVISISMPMMAFLSRSMKLPGASPTCHGDQAVLCEIMHNALVFYPIHEMKD